MTIRTRFWTVLFGLTLACAANAGAADQGTANLYQGSADFERVKALVGVWKGTAAVGNGAEEVTVEFTMTAGGRNIVERIFPGTSRELLNVYHDQAKKLVLTHYGALPNRPRLGLKQSDGAEMKFVLSNDPLVDPIRDTHMHSMRLTFTDGDNIVEEWVVFKRGKSSEVSTFKLTRVAAAVPGVTPALPVPGPDVPAEIQKK